MFEVSTNYSSYNFIIMLNGKKEATRFNGSFIHRAHTPHNMVYITIFMVTKVKLDFG